MPKGPSATPIVSICCITYNHERYIRDCIEGFLKQQIDFPFEIIVHDDASTDNTPKIIQNYARQLANMIVPIFQEENQYSKGKKIFPSFVFPKAHGKYIALCEGDDYWTDPLKLKKQVDFLEKHPGFVMCYHDTMLVDENSRVIKSSFLDSESKKDFSSDELIKGAWCATLTRCYRNVLSNYPAELNNAFNGDTFLTSLLGGFGKGKYMADIAPAAYRKHPESIWSSLDAQTKLLRSGSTRAWLHRYYRRLGLTEYEKYFKKLALNFLARAVGIMAQNGIDTNNRQITEVVQQYRDIIDDDIEATLRNLLNPAIKNGIAREGGAFDQRVLSGKTTQGNRSVIQRSNAQIDIANNDKFISLLVKVGWTDKAKRYVEYFEKASYFNSVKSPAVSIIVISWRLNPDTQKNLKILEKQRDDDFELIFVDNGGGAEEFESIKKYVDTYVRLNTNTGAYMARNIGAVFAKSPILFFLDDDGIPENDLVKSHIRIHSSYDVIAVRGVIRPKTRENPLNQLAKHYYLGDKPFPAYADLEGNTSFRAEPFFAVGGWDDNIRFGHGGVEISIRLLGYDNDKRKYVYSPDPIIYHDYAIDTEHLEEKRSKQEESKRRLKSKHPEWDAILADWHRYLGRTDLLIRREKIHSAGTGVNETEPSASRVDQIGSVEESLKRSRSLNSLMISVCIPTYNRGHFIGKAIESVLSQRDENYEIVVVDDGSNDHTIEVVKKYNSNKIRLIEKEHSGAPDSRNRAIKEARGEFIVWLDSDDQFLYGILEEYRRCLREYRDFDILYCDNIRRYEHQNREEIVRYPSFTGKIPPAKFLGGPPVPNVGTMIRKSLFDAVGFYDTGFRRAHDYEFWARALGQSIFRHCPKILYRHVMHGQQQLSPVDYADTDLSYEVRITENLIRNYSFEEMYPEVQWEELQPDTRDRVVSWIYLEFVKAFMKWGDPVKARSYLIKSLEIEPTPEKYILLEKVARSIGRTSVSSLAEIPPPLPGSPSLKVVALIAAHNEGDVIYHVIGDLVVQGVLVYLLDHCSTDSTVEEAKKWLGKGLIAIEKFPEDSNYAAENKSSYIWGDILKRKSEIALQLDADWFIHADADEFRESPWPGLTLREAVSVVDRIGYNAIDFALFNFRPVDNHFVPGKDVREYLKYYEGAEAYNVRQVKAWKKQSIPVDLISSGGHDVAFPGRKIYPIKFILRHYPIRSQQHGLTKVFQQRKNRFCEIERQKAWHVQYDNIKDKEHIFLKKPGQLCYLNMDEIRKRVLTQEDSRRVGDNHCGSKDNQSGLPVKTSREKQASTPYSKGGTSGYLRSCPKNLVSIVILTFNQLKYTQECAESIRTCTAEPHEIIFVDNGSTDGTVKWLRKLVKDNSHYKLIANKQNIGFSKGCNQGIEASSGEYILLLNNDVVVTENWLGGLLECFDREDRIGIVGPMTNHISGPQKVPQVDYASVADLHGYARAFRTQNRYRRIPNRRVVGFCMLFKRRLIDEIGLLDESFGSGNFEDDDLCLRACLAGYRNLIAGDVFIHHYGSRTFVGNKINYGSSLSRNRKVFQDKWRQPDILKRFGKRLIVQNGIFHAEEYFRKDELEKATASLLDAIKQAPDERQLYIQLAQMLIEKKRFDDALGILASLPGKKADSTQYALMGYCHEALGNDRSAEDDADQALALQPASALALNVKGVLAFKRNDRATAEAWFRSAIESDPCFGESYTNLGSLKWEAGEQDEALEAFQRGFILSPTIEDVATAYHTAIVATNSFDNAERVFREARALHPTHKRLAFLMIAVLLQQEKHEPAMSEIEKAMLQFGIDDGILSAGLEVRKQIGALKIDKSKSKRATLSVCMIVKNEEAHLAKCLMSVKPVVDEMIVVDTGSSDRSKDIAAALGARVFEYPWTNDFSEARNYSLAQASGDWILVLDADEAISTLDHGLLQKITRKRPSKHRAYIMVTRNYTNNPGSKGWAANEGRYIEEEAGAGWVPSPKVRLFVNDRRIRFVNPVHELVEPTLAKLGIPIRTCDVPVHHYGRLNRDKLIAKGKEYYRLGIAKIEQTQGDCNALKELAIQASEIGEYGEAVGVWQKVIERQPNDAVAYMNLGFAFLMMKQYASAAEFSKKAMAVDPELREAALNYAAAEMFAGDIRTAISTLEHLLEKHADYPPAMGRLAAAYIVSGRKAEGLRYLEKLNSRGFDCAGAWEEQVRAFISESKHEAAALLLAAAIEKGLGNGRMSQLMAECRSRIDGAVRLAGPAHASHSSMQDPREPISMNAGV